MVPFLALFRSQLWLPGWLRFIVTGDERTELPYPSAGLCWGRDLSAQPFIAGRPRGRGAFIFLMIAAAVLCFRAKHPVPCEEPRTDIHLLP